MELKNGNGSSFSATPPFEVLFSRSPENYLRLQNDPVQNLQSAFSRLNVSRSEGLGSLGFGEGKSLYGSRLEVDRLATVQEGNNVGMMVGPGMNTLSSTYQGGNGYFSDSERTERFKEFSTLPSPSGLLAGRSFSSLNANGYFVDSRRSRFNDLSILSSFSDQNGFFLGGTDEVDRCTTTSSLRSKSVCVDNHDINNNQTNININRFRRNHLLSEPLNCSNLGDLSGRIVALAKDQYGCRFLQRAIDEASNEEIDLIFMEVIDYFGEMMMDPFANYVIQKVVENCSEEQKLQILLMLTKDYFPFAHICLNTHGSRAVQKLLETLTTHKQISVAMSALSSCAVALTRDMNGHRVIQCCLKNFSDEYNKCLLNEVAHNCYQIATDKSGCCALQQCIDYSEGVARARLVHEIIVNALQLSEHQYGNYVVQHVLGLKDPQVTESLLRVLQGNYVSLSCDRYGSNVVEKCLTESEEQQSTRIIMELLRSPVASRLLVDPFGNYVIQSALKVAKGFVHLELLHLVRTNYAMMRNHVFGKWVLRKLPYIFGGLQK